MRIAVLWLASLALVALAASRLSFAQGAVQFPRMLSGSDFAFRLEGTAPDGQPMGTIMVRVNGQWVEAGYSTPYQRVK